MLQTSAGLRRSRQEELRPSFCHLHRRTLGLDTHGPSPLCSATPASACCVFQTCFNSPPICSAACSERIVSCRLALDDHHDVLDHRYRHVMSSRLA